MNAMRIGKIRMLVFALCVLMLSIYASRSWAPGGKRQPPHPQNQINPNPPDFLNPDPEFTNRNYKFGEESETTTQSTTQPTTPTTQPVAQESVGVSTNTADTSGEDTGTESTNPVSTAGQDTPPQGAVPVLQQVTPGKPREKFPLPKLQITHVVKPHKNQRIWLIYVLNSERRFVSVDTFVLELWSKAEVRHNEKGEIEFEGDPKFKVSLSSNNQPRMLTYQFLNKRKHAGFENEEGVLANNRILLAAKKRVKDWDYRKMPIKFSVSVADKYLKRYEEGDVFVLKKVFRNQRTRVIEAVKTITAYPNPEEEAVAGAPIRVAPRKLVTTWGELKSK